MTFLNCAFSAVLFDLDGTLLDSAYDLHACLNELLTEYQRPPVDLATVQRHLNKGAAQLITLGFAGTQELQQNLNLLKEKFLALYHQRIHEHPGHFFPGTIPLLEKLTAHEIPWGIVTNKQSIFTVPILEQAQLLKQTAVLICAEDVSHPKPDPESLQLACKKLALEPAACCYIGDSLGDMIAARASNMTAFLACWGYWHTKQYSTKDWPYDKILYHPNEFLNG